MAGYEPPKGTCCCAPPAPGLRMLTFPDGTRSGVFGLDEIFAALYEEGRQVSAETAREIVERLAVKNYIITSVRQQYCELIIEEYRKYVESRTDNSHIQNASSVGLPKPERRTLFSRLFRRRRAESA